ncbi:MAG TPA: hypothetical protein VGD02_07535 [Gemmatimonadaceae bacterium]
MKIHAGRIRILAVIGAVACASVTPAVPEDGEATLTRGGGITGLVESVHISSSAAGVAEGTYLRSDRQQARPLAVPSKSLDSTLLLIENLTAHAPSPPHDTRTICADVILIHVESRRGELVRTAQEECPHRDRASTAYWARLDSLFRRLIASAAN